MKTIKYLDLLAMDKIKFFPVSELNFIGDNLNKIEPSIKYSNEYLAELNEYYSNYIVNVLRYKTGELFVLSDYNNHNFYYASIVSFKKRTAALKLEPLHVENDSGNREFTCAIAALKGRKEDELIEKLVELGVNQICFFEGDHSIGKIENSRIERYMKISESSAAQSRKLLPPKVRFETLTDILENAVKRGAAIFILIEPSAILKCGGNSDEFLKDSKKYDALNKIFEELKKFNGRSVVMISGPEGGFSENEINYFKKLIQENKDNGNSDNEFYNTVGNNVDYNDDNNRIKAVISPFTLKNVVLRAELAPVAAFSIIKYECGDF